MVLYGQFAQELAGKEGKVSLLTWLQLLFTLSHPWPRKTCLTFFWGEGEGEHRQNVITLNFMRALPLTSLERSSLYLRGQTTCLWLYSCTIKCILLLFFFFFKDCANEIQGQFKLGEARRKRKQFACSQTTRLCPGVYLPLLCLWPFLTLLECQGDIQLSIELF